MRFGWTGASTRGWRPLLALGSAIALAGAASGCGSGSPSTSTATRPTAGVWSAPNADPRNTRHVGGPIDSASVSRLRVAWKLPLTALYAATPVVVDGVAYTQDLQSNVYAIDAQSGKLRWTKRYEAIDIGPNGVNVVDGRVYGATQKAAFALSAKTGAQLWMTPIARRAGDAIDMAPGVWKGTVYVSTAVASGGAVGTLWALDGASGRARWKWEQVPAKLWGHPDINAGGGLWHPPAFDERGNLYMGVANPLPFPGTSEYPWGSSRPGENRWNNSIVKLNARTGRFLWARQVLPHDIYDWDLECPVILAKADGKLVALASGKMGIVYAFDADSGKLLWKRSVGIHNGHDDDNLLALHRQYARIKHGERVYPGNWGGVETQMASDGDTLYVPVNNLWIVYHSQTKVRPQDAIDGTGELVALDIATGRVKWDRKLPHSPYGAATVANDLVFTTTYEGTVWALNTHTGAVAWRAPLSTGTDAPVTIAGDTLITAASVPLSEGLQPEIVAYRLGGKAGAGGAPHS